MEHVYECSDVLYFRNANRAGGNWVSLTRNIRYKNCTFELTHPKAETLYCNGIGEPYNGDLGGNRYLKNNKEGKP